MPGEPRVLICDRDRKWSRDARQRLREAGLRVVLIPERAPNRGHGDERHGEGRETSPAARGLLNFYERAA